MQFGLFGGARTKRSVGIEDSQGYESFIAYVVEADRLGVKQLFMVEHHFTGQGQVSASMTVLGYLAAGSSPEQIIAEFPDLTPEQVAACLDYARDLAQFAVEA